jgi:hypothetical protein
LNVIEPQHRTLAGAVGADDRADLALPDIEADIVEHLHDPEGQADIVYLEDHVTDVALGHAAASRVMDLAGNTSASQI